MRTKTFRHDSDRCGISLIEVLISIAVVAIGLLGVASLIPVAAYQAQEGARNDRMSNVGRRSFRELRVRGYTNPGTLVAPNWMVPTYSPPVLVVDAAGRVNPRAFCIDPLFNSHNVSEPPNLKRFPRIPNPPAHPIVRMPRMPVVSLAAQANTLGAPEMSVAQATEAFVFQDDLEMAIPNDKNAAPIQQMLGGNAKRAAKGEFSWFFMVFGSDSDWRTVSTVITRNRVIPQPNDPDEEYQALALIPLPTVGAVGAGPPTGPRFLLKNDASDVVVRWFQMPEKPIKVGHWVMLSQDPTPYNGFSGDEIFAWYRVKGVGEQQFNAGFPNRPSQYLQLQGPSWNTSRDTFVTWMPSVVAVYTREMQITAGN